MLSVHPTNTTENKESAFIYCINGKQDHSSISTLEGDGGDRRWFERASQILTFVFPTLGGPTYGSKPSTLGEVWGEANKETSSAQLTCAECTNPSPPPLQHPSA